MANYNFSMQYITKAEIIFEIESEKLIPTNLSICNGHLTYQSRDDCLRGRLVLKPIKKPTIRTPDPAKNHLI